MKPEVRAIIFDVDGTLAETEDIHRQAFNMAFAEAGLNWNWSVDLYKKLLRVTGGKERITHFAETYIDQGSRANLAGIARSLHERKTYFYTKLVAEGQVSLRPGIAALISTARMHGLKLGIATTTSQSNVEALLAITLGTEAMHWFDAVCCGDSVAKKKPAPDIYLNALQILSLPADAAIAIEDSWNGIRSARQAGLRVLATPSAYSLDEDFSEAEQVFASGDAVAAWIFGGLV